MAGHMQFLVIILTCLFISSTAMTTTQENILSALGFHQLSTATCNTRNPATPITIFAPTDSSLLTCPTCSLPLLLQEHSVLGHYSLHLLSNLPFGTKIETLAPNRCLTVTASTTKIFINGVEITQPEIFNDNNIIIHKLQGFVAHLSPLSCYIERQTSLTFPPPFPMSPFFQMRLMLRDAMLRLRVSGYGVVALAMRQKYDELLELRTMTLFALDDNSIFTGGKGYVADLRFHIVPNKRLMEADLVGLKENTPLKTMEMGESLVVTTAAGGGPLVPMRINYVKIKTTEIVCNNRIVVHGLALPFTRIRNRAVHSDLSQDERSG